MGIDTALAVAPQPRDRVCLHEIALLGFSNANNLLRLLCARIRADLTGVSRHRVNLNLLEVQPGGPAMFPVRRRIANIARGRTRWLGGWIRGQPPHPRACAGV